MDVQAYIIDAMLSFARHIENCSIIYIITIHYYYMHTINFGDLTLKHSFRNTKNGTLGPYKTRVLIKLLEGKNRGDVTLCFENVISSKQRSSSFIANQDVFSRVTVHTVAMLQRLHLLLHIRAKLTHGSYVKHTLRLD